MRREIFYVSERRSIRSITRSASREKRKGKEGSFFRKTCFSAPPPHPSPLSGSRPMDHLRRLICCRFSDSLPSRSYSKIHLRRLSDALSLRAYYKSISCSAAFQTRYRLSYTAGKHTSAASFTAFQISTDRSSPPLLPPPPHYRPPGHFRARARRRKRLVCVWVCVCVGSLRCADRRKMRPGVTRCHHIPPNVTGTHRSAPERTARALPGNRPPLRRAPGPYEILTSDV